METKGNPLYDMARKMKILSTVWEVSAKNYFESGRFKAGKFKLDQAKIEEFGKFAQRVEDKLYELAEDKKNWKRTIEDVFDEMLDKHIKVFFSIMFDGFYF